VGPTPLDESPKVDSGAVVSGASPLLVSAVVVVVVAELASVDVALVSLLAEVADVPSGGEVE
jgi:hypothetical protein